MPSIKDECVCGQSFGLQIFDGTTNFSSHNDRLRSIEIELRDSNIESIGELVLDLSHQRFVIGCWCESSLNPDQGVNLGSFLDRFENYCGCAKT